MISSYKSNPLKKLLWLSVLVAVLTITIKTYAWYLTDSVGLLSDAMAVSYTHLTLPTNREV